MVVGDNGIVQPFQRGIGAPQHQPAPRSSGRRADDVRAFRPSPARPGSRPAPARASSNWTRADTVPRRRGYGTPAPRRPCGFGDREAAAMPRLAAAIAAMRPRRRESVIEVIAVPAPASGFIVQRHARTAAHYPINDEHSKNQEQERSSPNQQRFGLQRRIEAHELPVAVRHELEDGIVVLPATSISRTWRRKSLASSTLESAMDSFWHTRQRRSCVMCSNRACNAGSSS